MKNKNLLITMIVLVVVVIVLGILNVKKGAEEFKMPTSDTLWSESSIFTNESYQNDQREGIKAEYNAFDNKYTLDNPYVKVNPFDINPLSAYVIFDSNVPVSYSYEVIDQENGLNFNYSSDKYDTRVIIPVIGLFENMDNQVTITTKDKDGNTNSKDLNITTGSADYNEVKVKQYDDIDESIISGWYFDPFYNAFDTQGNIRYNLNVGVEDNYMKFTDGSFFVKVDNYQTIYELNIMGEILNVYKTPSAQYNFHHDIVKANDKVYALGSYNVELDNVPYSESFIFEYDKPGKPSRIIDIFDKFDENMVSLYGTPNQNDPVHINSLEYLEEENELIISSQSQSFIAGINIDTEDVDWVIQDENLAIENKDKLLQIINPDEFERTSGQHTAFLTNNSKYDSYKDNGEYVISVFNNNNCKDIDGNLLYKTYEEDTNQEACVYDESDVLIYAINLEKRTVEQIDKIVIDGEYAPIMSSVFDVDGDNFVIHYNEGNNPTSYVVNSEGIPLIKFEVNYDGNGYYRAHFKTQEELYTMLDKI